MRLPGYVLCLALLCLGTLLRAQESLRFDKLEAEQGAWQSIVYGLVQDSLHNVWACTETGVFRFNSRETIVYDRYRGLPGNFSNRIKAIHIDNNNRLWIGGEKGIAHYEAKQDSFIWLKPHEGRGPSLVKTIISDPSGHLWVGAYNGLWAFSPGSDSVTEFNQRLALRDIESLFWMDGKVLAGGASQLMVYDVLSGKADSLVFARTNPTVTAIFQEGELLLFGTKEQGLFRSNSQLKSLRSIPFGAFSGPKYPIYDIVREPDGSYLLASDGLGMIRLDSGFSQVTNYRNDVNDTRSISSDGVYDLLQGTEGILWIATYGGGLNMLVPEHNRFGSITHQPNDPNSIAHNFSRAVIEDEEGNIWFGTKLGLSIWYRGENRWKHIRFSGEENSAGQQPLIVMALEEDGDYIWAGTYNAGLYRIHKGSLNQRYFGSDAAASTGISLKKIFAAERDEQGNIWFGGIDGKLECLKKTGEVVEYPVEQVKSISCSRRGGVWVGGRKGVQHIIDGQLEQLDALESGRNGLQYNTINCIYEYDDNCLIVGTNGDGLLLYEAERQRLHKLNIRDGLPSDIIQGVLFRDKSEVWLSTARGLAHLSMSPTDTSIRIFDRSDGLPSTEYNYGSYCQLRDENFIFGGVNGLVMFQPGGIVRDSIAPQVVLEELRVLNQEVMAGEPPLEAHINACAQLNLPFSKNALSLRFVGVLHSAPDKVNYTWRLEGLDEAWSEPSPESQTNFTNLAPGDYTFRVKAANRDGAWGPERQLNIHIASPWWTSPAAISGYILLGLLALFLAVYLARLFINKRNAEQQIDFFNNITHELKTPLAILLASLEDANEKVSGESSMKRIKTTVKRLSGLFEQLLNFHRVNSDGMLGGRIRKVQLDAHIEEKLLSLKPMLDEKKLKVEVQSGWNPEVFYCNVEVFDKIFFNLLSNAIKYSQEGGQINILLGEEKKKQLKLSVSDQGIGIPRDQQKNILKKYYRGRNAINSQVPGTGLGLIMVKSLVEKQGGKIAFESKEKEGTTFSVTLPDQEEQYHQAAVLPEAVQTAAADYGGAGIEAFRQAKIMVVEDNDELRELLVRKLKQYFVVYEANNGLVALEKVREHFPDLIITDLIMPEMDGLAMSKAIMDDITLNHIPIFMISVLGGSAQKVESIEHGIREYMEKPIDLNLLLAKIVNTLSWQAKLRGKYQHGVEIQNAQSLGNQRDAEFINGLEQFTLDHIQNENFAVADLCEYIGMSRTSLYMKLKSLIDMSPQDFIINTRLKYARKLLVEGNGRIKEVAYDAGFSNPKYFSTSFKKRFGLSPSAFLESLRKGKH